MRALLRAATPPPPCLPTITYAHSHFYPHSPSVCVPSSSLTLPTTNPSTPLPHVQDVATGDHGLHVGCRTGNLALVDQLMKYKADSELPNRLGYFPINYCWDFWKKYNQQILRDPQENLTCQILFTLLSYGAGSQRQDQKGNTALHKAAQYGPLRAVLMLMGFRGDPHTRNNLVQRPVDVARKYKQHEIVKVFGMWDMITEQMAATDFQV